MICRYEWVSMQNAKPQLTPGCNLRACLDETDVRRSVPWVCPFASRERTGQGGRQPVQSVTQPPQEPRLQSHSRRSLGSRRHPPVSSLIVSFGTCRLRQVTRRFVRRLSCTGGFITEVFMALPDDTLDGSFSCSLGDGGGSDVFTTGRLSVVPQRRLARGSVTTEGRFGVKPVLQYLAYRLSSVTRHVLFSLCLAL
jgi:hypothetical protein